MNNELECVQLAYVSFTMLDAAQPRIRKNRCGTITLELNNTFGFTFSSADELVAFLESARMQVHRLGAGGAGLV